MGMISPGIIGNREIGLWKNVLIASVPLQIGWLSSHLFVWIILMRNYLINSLSYYIQSDMRGVIDSGGEGKGDALRLCGLMTIDVRLLCEVRGIGWRVEMW